MLPAQIIMCQNIGCYVSFFQQSSPNNQSTEQLCTTEIEIRQFNSMRNTDCSHFINIQKTVFIFSLTTNKLCQFKHEILKAQSVLCSHKQISYNMYASMSNVKASAELTINNNHQNIRSVYPAVTLQFTTK